ncbi:MAG: hypothetical protein KDA84_28505, partial [Planctomycetaceae bacterium]|nr:hypothetical protein [Planctomycetaceae bacterium]
MFHHWFNWNRLTQSVQRRGRQLRRHHRRPNTSPTIEVLEDRTLLDAAFPEFLDPTPGDDNRFGDTVLVLSTGNVVITSPDDDTNARNAGAVHLFNGATGELISTIRGASVSERIGDGGVTDLGKGNYVIVSSEWNNGNIQR